MKSFAWLWGLAPLAALIVLPFWLRPAAEGRFADAEAERIVIYTPHTESVKREFEVAFRRYYRAKFDRDIMLDFRSPGGTTDIVRFIRASFTNAFEKEWTAAGNRWSDDVAGAFANSRLGGDASAEARRARAMFLAGDTSMGGDIFWGGGTYDHQQQADAGFAVDAGIARMHPEYFAPEAMAAELSGERIYDAGGRYYGVCLASFGICYNRDRVAELADPTPPDRWADLAEPRFFGVVAVADPSKSGSIAKCFELIVQQAITETLASGGDVAAGWAAGLTRIKRMVANAGVITESASVVANRVAGGESAAGMAIDFYALSTADWLERQTGAPSPLVYVVPYRGSSVSPDPVQLLRGAPNSEAAREFIAFLLSIEGQKLLDFRADTPGGPEKTALLRAPVRRELYEEPYLKYRSNPDYNPYRDAGEVIYHAEWTSPYFNLLRILIRCAMLDVQNELAQAWQAIIAAGGPEAVPEAYAEFSRLPFEYAQAGDMAGKLRVSQEWSALDVARMRREWAVAARDQYRRSAELARAGR